MAIMETLKGYWNAAAHHPQIKPILIVTSIVALTIITSLIILYHGAIRNYFINLSEHPENYTKGIMILSGAVVLSIVGPIFIIHYFCKKKGICL